MKIKIKNPINEKVYFINIPLKEKDLKNEMDSIITYISSLNNRIDELEKKVNKLEQYIPLINEYKLEKEKVKFQGFHKEIKKEEGFHINFYLDDKITKIKAHPDDLFAEIALKYSHLINMNEELHFLYNANELNLNDGKSLKELKLKSGSNVEVYVFGGFNTSFNIYFNLHGERINISGEPKMKFSNLIYKFFLKCGIDENKSFF